VAVPSLILKWGLEIEIGASAVLRASAKIEASYEKSLSALGLSPYNGFLILKTC
jgi:hypothetical protein